MTTMVAAVGMGRQVGSGEVALAQGVARESVAKNILLFFAAPFIGLAYIVAFPFIGVAAAVKIALRQG
ncbi:MAG TPA: hypothetical protein VN317_00805 [Candidatus Methanoperedens sp.]|nr:hypothetical protein [Candidatus Methanoperedens sp.]